MSVLIIAEHGKQKLKPATLNVITAALALKTNEIAVLLVGKQIEALAKEVSEYEGVTKVFLCDDDSLENPTAEQLAPLICEMAKNFSYILAPSTTFGKNLLPRCAAILDIPQITDVTAIIDEKTFEHPIYAGNIIATVQSDSPKNCLTIRTTAFAKAEKKNNISEIIKISLPPLVGRSANFVELRENISARPELTAARVVVSGGRGMGNGENFSLLEKLADKLPDCAIGASRAAVDAGFVPNDYQVGQTGKIVAPELYIAVGISGAIQHLAGMKDSKIIVAINKDENAPIFEVADYGLVADLFQAVPEMIKKI
jgi:electron transfer flavoprotein alpha subunit